MAEQDGQRVVGKVEADQPRRDPGSQDESDPGLNLQHNEKEAGVDCEGVGNALEHENLSDRIICEIDADQIA